MAPKKSALMTEKSQTQAGNPAEINADAGLTPVEGRADHVDPIALAMDQALGLDATRPFSSMSRWNSHAIEFAWSLAPVVCDIFSLAVKACVELQLSWLSWVPGWNLGSGADASAAAESGEYRRQMAESMDVAIGAQPAQPGAAVPLATPPVAISAIPAYAEEPAALDEDEALDERAMAAAS